MPPSLPILSGKEAIKIFQRLGFHIVRQKGSHILMKRENIACVVPNHKELKVGTLRGVLKQDNVSAEEFLQDL